MRYAGILYGITNCVSTIPGIVAPIVIGQLTPNKTQEEWRNVFYVCGAFTLVGAIVFGGFAQGELEPWAVEVGEELVVEPSGCHGNDAEDKQKLEADNLAFDSDEEKMPAKIDKEIKDILDARL